jgi:hypothetical protein
VSRSGSLNILKEKEGYESGETLAGEDEFEFIGGDLSKPTFDALLNLFRNKGHDLKPKAGFICQTAGFDADDLDNLEPVALDGDGLPVPGHTDGQGACPLYADDGVTRLLYPDGTPRNQHLWETGVVVYSAEGCANPNQSIMIVGFSEILMFDVKGPPANTIRAIVLCNYVDSGDSRGSGGQYGTLGPIPGLVQ